MANRYRGIESDYGSLKDLSSQKTNHQSIQVNYLDGKTGKKFFWEFIYDNKYTRYTICESLDVNEEDITPDEVDLSFLDGMFDESEMATLSDVWAESSALTGFETPEDEEPHEEDDDEYDPNDTLSADTDSDIKVSYIEDDSISDNVKCIKVGNYKGDYVLRDYGRIIYDEYIYSPGPLNMLKKVAGDPKSIEMTDELFNSMVRYSATKGVHKVASELRVYGDSLSNVTQYENADGERLEEVKNSRGEVLMQKYYNPKTDVTVEARYLYQGKFLDKERVFGRVEFDIDYSEYELTLDSKSQGSRKGKFKFKTGRKCLYIPKIDFFKSFLNLGYVEYSDYQIIDTPEKLQDIVDMLLKEYPDKDRVIGYDAETQGLKFHRWISKPHQLVTHSLSWKDHQSIIVPVRMKYCRNIDPIEAAEILRPILEVYPILAHNGAADVRFNWCRDKRERINLNLQEDTMHLIKHIMPFVNHREVLGYGRAIDDLIHQTFRDPETGRTIDMIDLHKYVYKTCDVDFDFSLLNEIYMQYYGCPDTDLMRMLWKILRKKLSNKEQLLAYKNTVLFSKNVAINSSYSGLGINTAEIEKEKNHAQNVVDRLESVMYQLSGENKQTLSFTSAPQKCNYIFGKMGAPVEYARRTKEGKLSADKTVVKNLASIVNNQPSDIFKQDILDESGDVVVTKDELNRLKYPFCRLLRIHGDLVKNITAFYNGLLNSSTEGVYYGDYRIGATDTWRTTDRVQITKKNIKHYLGPVGMGEGKDSEWGWFSVDYAAEEFRLTVNGSDDDALKDMLTDPEADPHTMVTSELYNIPPYKVSGDLRKKTKSCNFGIIYGMKARALSQTIFNTDTPTQDQVRQAQELYDLYCYKRALMLKPLQKAKDHVRNTGWIINHLGYKMVYHQIVDIINYQDQVYSRQADMMKPPIPVIDNDLKARNIGKLLNACGNYPIQSWAAGILMVVYNKICAAIHSLGFEDDIVIPLQVHDEIGGYFRKDKVHPYLLIKLFNDCMVSKLEYLKKPKIAPLYIGIGFGASWGDAKDDNAEIPVALQSIIIDEWNNGTAPSLEEINNEGIYNHFDRRIKEYMKSRLHELYHDMIEAKHFNRQEMQHRLNSNMFVGKKIDELFNTNDKKTKEIIIEKYIELILDMPIDEAVKAGYTWEEGEIIVEESERKLTDDEIQDFFFLPQTHPRLHIEEMTVTIDLKDVYKPIADTALEYIKSLCNPEENIHNKQVIVNMPNGNVFLKQKMLGMPVNFSEKFDQILSGQKVSIKYNQKLRCPIVDITKTPFEYKKEDGVMKMVIDLNILNDINPRLFKGLAPFIEHYATKSPIANIQIWLRGKNEVDTGLRMVAIDDRMRIGCENLIELATLLNTDIDKAKEYADSKSISRDWIDYLKWSEVG